MAGKMNERYSRLLEPETNRLLLLHHRNASRYYRMNMAFLTIFLGVSLRNYYANQAIFGSERMGKVYLGLIIGGMVGIGIFDKRHIRNLYLDPSGKEIHIETYRFFGLLDQSKEHTMKIKNLRGNRSFLSPHMQIYQLEFIKEGKWTKRRSLFYRPQYIADADLWQTIRKGNEVAHIATPIEVNEEAEQLKRLKKKAEAKSKYR